MRVLITGANGYLGGRLAEILSEKYAVCVLSRKPLEGYDCSIADITNRSDVFVALAKIKPDIVLHLAAANEVLCAKNPELAMKINRDGTKNVLEAAESVGVKKFLYFSTFHVYGKSEGIITEDTIPEPKHPYGITKLEGEKVCENAEIAYVLRVANGIGKPASSSIERWSLVLLDLCRSVHETGKIVLKTPGYQKRDFISIEDVAQATERIIQSISDVRLYNVGSGTSFSIREIAESVGYTYKELYGRDAEVEIPDGNSEESELRLDITRIKSLGYVPTTNLKNAVSETLRFCEVFK